MVPISYIYNFVVEDGKLATGTAGQVIEKKLTAHIKKSIDQKDFVVFTIDAHGPKDSFHPESHLFPPRNMIGAGGRELYDSLKSLYQGYEQEENVYQINRRYYSTFSGTDLNICLRERQIADIYLTGICTSIYVLHTAVDAYNLGYKFHIFKGAAANLDPVEHEWALRHSESILGAEIL